MRSIDSHDSPSPRPRVHAWVALAFAPLAACGEGLIVGQLDPPPGAGPPSSRDAGAAREDAGVVPTDGGPRPDAGAINPGASDAGARPAVDAGAPEPGGWDPAWARREGEMLTLVNAQRAMGANCGGRRFGPAGPLTMNAELQEAARLHSKDMADRDYFDHTALDGRSPWDRMSAAGYTGAAIGENIAAGNTTAQDTFTQWLTSPGHCSNMMNADATEIGVGYAYNAGSSYSHYWTQTFGAR